MKSSKMILLPLDGTEAALKALLPAKSLAILLNAYIHIIHISDETLTHEELLKKVKISSKDMPEFVITHRRGKRAEIILEESKSASYIVICNNKKDIINPVTIKIMENSDIPVLLINPDTVMGDKRWTPKKILMPLDGSPDSAQALDASIEIIRSAKTDIDVVHIFNLEGERDENSMRIPYYMDHPSHEWSLWSNEFLKRFCPNCFPDSNVKLHVSVHDSAKEILDFYKKNKSDLIVLAWKGKLFPGHGEVLKKIIREISCPVLLIKIIPGKEFPDYCTVR